jgi:hypothetical protein
VVNAAPSVTADHSLLAPHEKEENARETRPLASYEVDLLRESFEHSAGTQTHDKQVIEICLKRKSARDGAGEANQD